MNHVSKPEEVRLSNGIPVIFQNQEGTVGTVYWWVQAGSTDETPPEAGFAHFLEHMLFKDAAAKETGRASTGQTARLIESFGGDINAYTTFDQTVYHVTCSAVHWEKVLDAFGVMAKPQKFLKSDFEREREVILEELRRGNDSPDRQLYEKLFGLTYKKHPYGRPVIGFEKILRGAKLSQLESFYKRCYVSERMGIILVGPIDEARKSAMLKVLEKRFGAKSIPVRKSQKKQRPTEESERGFSFKNLFFDVKTPSLALSFRVPEITHPDVPALEVLASVLGAGESARLHQKLFYEKKLCTEVGASVYIPYDQGMMIFNADLESTDRAEEFLKALHAEIEAVKEHLIEPHELQRVITNVESEKLYSTQTVDGIAGRLGFLRFNLGNLHYDSEYLAAIREVTAEDLREVAKRYLNENRLTAVLLQPKGEKAFIWPKALFTNPTGAEKKTSKAATKNKKQSIVKTFQTATGLKVVHAYRPGNPVIATHLSALGGTRLEEFLGEDFYGASHIFAQTWAKGAAGKTSKEIAHFVESRAASIDGFSGKNTVGLQMTTLGRDWADLSRLFIEVFNQPTFSDEELFLSRKVAEESIKTIQDHSSQVCTMQFLDTLFQEHPYGKSILGNLETLGKHDSAQMKMIHSKWLQPKNMTLSIVGGLNEDQLHLFLQDFEKHLHKDSSHFGDQEPIAEKALKAPRWAHTHFGREQTHIIVGGLGISMFDKRRSALRLLQSILGGQSGRLFIELREKKSMAYTVAPIGMDGIEPGYVGTYIACAPAKRKEAVLGIRSVLEALAKKGPSKEELQRAKNYSIGQRAMDLQAVWSQAAAFGLENLYRGAVETDAEFIKRLNDVTAKDIQKICTELYLDAPQVTVFVS